jgi:ribose transport system permease protein
MNEQSLTYPEHKQQNRIKIGQSIYMLVPLTGLIVVVAGLAIATGGQSISAFNLKILVNQVVVLAVVGTGATFIFTMGHFDISLGMGTCLAATLGAIAANATGSVLIMFIVCIASAICVSLLNGACIALFKLPSFIVTLATMNIMSAGVALLIGTSPMLTITVGVTYLDTTTVKLLVLVFIIVLSTFMFNFNKLGRGNKIIGGNPTVALQSGISLVRNTIYTFLLSGIGVGLGAFLLMARTGSVSQQTGSSLGFDIIIAIVMGGMPVSGGARSRITAAIIGACTITALKNGLVILGLSVGALQAVQGLLFVLVVGVLALRNREKLLAR